MAQRQQLLARLRQGLRRAAYQDEVAAGLGEGLRDRPADPAAAARDEGAPSLDAEQVEDAHAILLRTVLYPYAGAGIASTSLNSGGALPNFAVYSSRVGARRTCTFVAWCSAMSASLCSMKGFL